MTQAAIAPEAAAGALAAARSTVPSTGPSAAPLATPLSATLRHWHFAADGLWLSLSPAEAGLPAAVLLNKACACAAALVLAQAEPLLAALAQAGLASPERWRWDEDQAPPRDGRVQARGHWHGAQGAPGGAPPQGPHASTVQAHLALPLTALRALPAAPALPGLVWQPLPGEWVLAEWTLAEAEHRALEPGGLLLLDGPSSPRLRARGEAPADLAGDPAVRHAVTNVTAGPAGSRRCQLVCRSEQPLPLAALLGWEEPPAVRPALSQLICQLIDPALPEAPLAHGRLLPWGSGQALRIDSV